MPKRKKGTMISTLVATNALVTKSSGGILRQPLEKSFSVWLAQALHSSRDLMVLPLTSSKLPNPNKDLMGMVMMLQRDNLGTNIDRFA
jgi:hypothetical protein